MLAVRLGCSAGTYAMLAPVSVMAHLACRQYIIIHNSQHSLILALIAPSLTNKY